MHEKHHFWLVFLFFSCKSRCVRIVNIYPLSFCWFLDFIPLTETRRQKEGPTTYSGPLTGEIQRLRKGRHKYPVAAQKERSARPGTRSPCILGKSSRGHTSRHYLPWHKIKQLRQSALSHLSHQMVGEVILWLPTLHNCKQSSCPPQRYLWQNGRELIPPL